MKKSTEASRLKACIQAAPQNCQVLVSAELAQYFTTVPKDGRTYIVADPRRPSVYHWTSPDGSYKRFDDKIPPLATGGIPMVIHEKRVFDQGRRKGKKTRFAHKVCAKATVIHQDTAPPAICLIDIHRVMRITGFKKSFIYERVDFPEPVRLGTTRRSAVRWLENEVIQWAKDLLSQRASIAGGVKS